MKTTFKTTVSKDEVKTATGLRVPPEAIAALGARKNPPVIVTIGSYSYHTTVGIMGGVPMLPLSAQHREAAGVKAGDEVEVTIELDTEPRIIEVPDDLAAALSAKPGARALFDALATSRRKEGCQAR